jgi:hypothetical protein
MLLWRHRSLKVRLAVSRNLQKVSHIRIIEDSKRLSEQCISKASRSIQQSWMLSKYGSRISNSLKFMYAIHYMYLPGWQASRSSRLSPRSDLAQCRYQQYRSTAEQSLEILARDRRAYATFTGRILLIDLICELEDICCMGRVIMSSDGFELFFLLGR